MKNLFILTTIFISSLSYSQVTIGKTTIDGGGILDFGDDGNKGIILPIADISDNTQVFTNGTFLMDKTDMKIKVYEDNIWVDLSDEGSIEAQVNPKDPSQIVTTAIVLNQTKEIGKGMVIGDVDTEGNPISGAEGVLVLESADKALILPKVADPHLNIPSPVAGTMCYDTVSNSLAIFDGVVWNYWK